MADPTVNSMLIPQKTLSTTRINLHNSLAFTALLYGWENRTSKAGDTGRITAAEMKYMRTITGYTRSD
jgi:hypothetical protein